MSKRQAGWVLAKSMYHIIIDTQILCTFLRTLPKTLLAKRDKLGSCSACMYHMKVFQIIDIQILCTFLRTMVLASRASGCLFGHPNPQK